MSVQVVGDLASMPLDMFMREIGRVALWALYTSSFFGALLALFAFLALRRFVRLVERRRSLRK